ncbi:MAG: LPXTG cell wall anchor domain-containing protein, partial [Coriobacteriales bacterium]|nr:LPXTG cell wall anchor domain-containing protein [Coriobacteriales bacterium]
DRLGKGTTPLTPPGGEQPSINPDGTTPHTGDSSPIVLVAVLASLGLLTLSAAVVIDRRKAARRSLAKGKR